VCVPLTIGGKLIGFVSLGRKRDLDGFSTQDLVLLEAVAAEASIALENARLYQELKRSQDIIRRADRLSALGTLAAGIAHEVRNPLVSIQTFFQLAPERLHDEEFFTTFLSMTANEVKRISNLITELLSFARSPTRSLGAISVNEVAERVMTLLEPETRKHELTLTRALSADVPLVYADADQIKQVLINLVLNAIQATPPGGKIWVTSRAVQDQGSTFGRLEIRDDGRGIPEERLTDIFNPFFTTKDKGTGLGLTIAHRIVTEHGGFIRVESKEGRGSSFSVDLPGVSSENAYPAPLPEDTRARTAS
jgi:signal transduction histidine kinase